MQQILIVVKDLFSSFNYGTFYIFDLNLFPFGLFLLFFFARWQKGTIEHVAFVFVTFHDSDGMFSACARARA